MAKFAEGTEVPAGRSKAEIERILTRFGADQFGYGWRGDSAMVVFRAQGRHIRFVLPMPTKEDLRGSRSADAQEREERRRWRALTLCIKAKLESVESRIETFDDAFMPHIVMPNGDTFGHWAKPQIHKAIESGQMPQSLMLEDRRGPTD